MCGFRLSWQRQKRKIAVYVHPMNKYVEEEERGREGGGRQDARLDEHDHIADVVAGEAWGDLGMREWKRRGGWVCSLSACGDREGDGGAPSLRRTPGAGR